MMAGNRGLINSSLDILVILQLLSDLVTIEHNRMSRVVPGVVQGSGNIAGIFADGLYTGVPLEIWLELESN